MNKTQWICPKWDVCEDRHACNHIKPHDPVVIDDNCMIEPCPAYYDDLDEDGQPKKIVCVPYAEPIILEEELFDI